MKYLYKIIILSLTLVSLKTNAQENFAGTWEHQSGNEIFRVFIWQDEEDSTVFKGHYEKLTIVSGLESYLYCSDKEKFQDHNKGWLPYVIYATGNDDSIGGRIIDNTVNESQYEQQKPGNLILEVINNNPNTVRWTVSRIRGIKINEAPNFSVPTEIILTKVE